MSPLASAYARARGADRMSSFGDFVALSDVCDVATAKVLQHEVSDGVIAPGYDDEALAILKTKKKGRYNVIQIDSNYVPHEMETKEVFGVTFEQRRNADSIGKDCLQKIVTKNKDLPKGPTGSSHCPDYPQVYPIKFRLLRQGRTDHRRRCRTAVPRPLYALAGDKADKWWLRQSPKALSLPFKPDTPKPVRIILLMSIFPTTMMTSLLTESGKRSLQKSRNA